MRSYFVRRLKQVKAKSIISCILIFSVLLNGCASTAGANSTQTQQQQQQQQEVTEIIGITVGVLAVTIFACVLVATANGKKAKAKAKADEAKFQGCVGKTKAEVYDLYGPPDNIVDNGQGDGGSILIYQTVVTSGGGDYPVSSTTYRKLFYLNKDNIVTSVKEDTH